MEMYEAMEDWDEIRGLRHEDCECEECLMRLHEYYEEAVAHSFKRPSLLDMLHVEVVDPHRGPTCTQPWCWGCGKAPSGETGEPPLCLSCGEHVGPCGEPAGACGLCFDHCVNEITACKEAEDHGRTE